MDFIKKVLSDPSLAAFSASGFAPLQTYYDASALATKTLFTSSPSSVSIATMLLAVFYCWQWNLSGYWSWVDRCWSILPAIYAITFALWPGASSREVVMAVLATLWGIRLSYNFARKGGYGSEEDYRWPVLRAWFKKNDPFHPLFQEVFNLSFVSFYQHALIWGFVAPPMFVASQNKTPLNSNDVVLTVMFIVFLVLETWTDETQWAFQNAKYAMTVQERKAAGGDFARGFCTTGPFKFSRHLNFFSEQSIWVTFYLFSVSSKPGSPLINWSFAGAFLLILLFQGSTQMTEALTLAKYPAYAAYQHSTSRLLPWFPGPSLDSADGKLITRNVSSTTEKDQVDTSSTNGGNGGAKKDRRRSKSSKSQ